MELKIPSLAKKIAKKLGVKSVADYLRRPAENAKYWSDVNVTAHQRFPSAEASLEYFHWRNSQYHHYIELMPVAGQDGKAVLDYGCGPGNDLAGFSAYSKPSRLVGMDISPRSIAEAKDRVALHSDSAEVLRITENDDNRIPLDDSSMDYIHSSGVVHHAIDPTKVLREFRRVLKPSGKCRIMVYNYDSLWLHLWVAYIKQFCENTFPGLDVRAAFGKTTDGVHCPISRVYKPQEFIDVVEPCGFKGRFLGAAVSLFETSLLPRRFEALYNINFAREHREFLLALTYCDKGFPMYNGTYAGLDGCYELTPS
jgi:ubiquinone/menaquinone biosynthesis C-methylase UbiE